MTDFHFLRPGWLLAFLPLAVLLWLLYRRRGGGGDWRDVCDPALLPYILIGAPGRGPRRWLPLAALSGTLALLALAGPAWERLPAPVFRNLSALVVAVDLSFAMDAGDLKPNRLERARYKIADLLEARRDGQTALVVYAGDAFTVTPLTDDGATIAAQLSALSTELMPVQGSRVDLALETAARLLRQAGLRRGDVLLVSAGGGAERAESTAARLAAEGYRVSVLGAGTAAGAPVALPGGGFLKDEKGGILVPRLDEPALRRLAAAGGGLYRTLEAGAADLDGLLRFFDRPVADADGGAATIRIDQWQERGPWLLLALLPLAALSFRRGWLGLWLGLILAPLPDPAAAFDWESLWRTPDQRAQRAFDAGDYGTAAELFRDPAWKGAAEYRAGTDPLKTWEALDTPSAHYNRGNALARQGRLEDALKAYDLALELNGREAGPDRRLEEDARHNRRQVEEALKRQREQQKQEQQQPEPSGGGGEKQGQSPQQTAGGGSERNRDDSRDGGQPQQSSSGTGETAQGQDGNGTPETGRDQENRADGAQQTARGSEPEERSGKDGKSPAPQPDQPDSARPDPQAGGAAAHPETAEAGEAGAESAAAGTDPEALRAEEQWLRRIPDDPGGLLKRKFYYQYRQRQQARDEEP